MDLTDEIKKAEKEEVEKILNTFITNIRNNILEFSLTIPSLVYSDDFEYAVKQKMFPSDIDIIYLKRNLVPYKAHFIMKYSNEYYLIKETANNLLKSHPSKLTFKIKKISKGRFKKRNKQIYQQLNKNIINVLY